MFPAGAVFVAAGYALLYYAIYAMSHFNAENGTSSGIPLVVLLGAKPTGDFSSPPLTMGFNSSQTTSAQPSPPNTKVVPA